MSTRLFTRTADLYRRTVDTAAPRPTTSFEFVRQVKGGIRQRTTGSAFDAGLTLSEEWSFYLKPEDDDVVHGDQLDVDGERYEVVSKPMPAWNARSGLIHHYEVRIRKAGR